MREKRTLLLVLKITSLSSFLAALLVGGALAWVWLSGQFTSIDSELNLPIIKITVGKKEEDAEFKTKYDRIVEKLTKVEEFSLYEDIFQRDPFSKKKTFQEELPFSLVKIELLPYDAVYMGYIDMPDGSRVGQFNLGERTKFVKLGGKIKDAELLNILPDRAKLIGAQGELIELEVNKAAYSDKYQALLNNSQENRQVWVKSGSEVWGYKILDITEDSVILYINSNKIILGK